MTPPPRRVGSTRDDYADEVGAAALARQRAEAELRLECCAELKTAGHHTMCRNYDEPTVPEVHPDQETLI